jgi:hypothetical protein
VTHEFVWSIGAYTVDLESKAPSPQSPTPIPRESPQSNCRINPPCLPALVACRRFWWGVGGKTWKMYVISIPSNQVRRERSTGKSAVITKLYYYVAFMLKSSGGDTRKRDRIQVIHKLFTVAHYIKVKD